MQWGWEPEVTWLHKGPRDRGQLCNGVEEGRDGQVSQDKGRSQKQRGKEGSTEHT